MEEIRRSQVEVASLYKCFPIIYKVIYIQGGKTRRISEPCETPPPSWIHRTWRYNLCATHYLNVQLFNCWIGSSILNGRVWNWTCFFAGVGSSKKPVLRVQWSLGKDTKTYKNQASRVYLCSRQCSWTSWTPTTHLLLASSRISSLESTSSSIELKSCDNGKTDPARPSKNWKKKVLLPGR